MRFLFTLAAVATAVQLSAGVALAQSAPDQCMDMYNPEYYGSLIARLEQLEANQGLRNPCDCSQGGYYGQLDTVIVQPFLSENSAFPAQDDDSNISNIAFNFDPEFSPRIEAGYLAPTSEIGWRARYWHFETETTAGPATDGNGLIANDAVGVSVGASVQDIDTITAVIYDMNVDVLDLEATRATGLGSFAAGIRFASLDQKYNLDSDEGTLVTDLEATGIGPTVAYEWKKRAPYVEGLSWLANVRGSLLYGNKDVNSVASNYDDYDFDDQSLMSNLETQLGVEYRQASGFFVRAALEAQYWANTGNATNQNIGSGDDTNDGEFMSNILDDDLGFLGLVLGVGYIY